MFDNFIIKEATFYNWCASVGLKEVFLERLSNNLYEHLQDDELADWDVTAIMNFSDAIIKENIDKIDEYLKTHDVNLSNINDAIDEIIEDVLISKIKIK